MPPATKVPGSDPAQHLQMGQTQDYDGIRLSGQDVVGNLQPEAWRADTVDRGDGYT